MSRLQQDYKTNQSQLATTLGVDNIMATPRLEKVVVNVGWGELKGNDALQKSVAEVLSLITGQKPVPTRAKKAIAGFKLRAGDTVGYKVTLRGQRMYDFLDRLITYVLPRLRDFQGVSLKGFDQFGNYSFGLKEQTVFPEIPFQASDRTWGMEITIVTTGTTSKSAQALLASFGFPFAKAEGEA